MEFFKIRGFVDREAIYLDFGYGEQLKEIVNSLVVSNDIIHFEGKNKKNTDVLFFGEVGAVSDNVKNFFDSLEINYIKYKRQEIYDLYADEQLGKEIKKTILICEIDKELDCIDYDKSDLVVIANRIRRIKKLVLKEFFFSDKPIIFSLKAYFGFFVNEAMKKEIEASNLIGFKFIPLDKLHLPDF